MKSVLHFGYPVVNILTQYLIDLPVIVWYIIKDLIKAIEHVVRVFKFNNVTIDRSIYKEIVNSFFKDRVIDKLFRQIELSFIIK
jgi:hypothetical protein